MDRTDRQEMAVIAILCDTHFDTLRGLNTHIEKIHGSTGLRRLPHATPIPSTRPITNRTDPLPQYPQATYGPIAPGTMTEFLSSKHFEKAKKGNSVKEICKRWSLVTRKLTNKFHVVYPDGTIYKDYWGDAVQAATKFFEDDPSWMNQLLLTAI